MSDEPRQLPPFWTDLRRHPLTQVAAVFGGGSWLALQAFDIFGMPTAAVRVIGVVCIAIFLALVAFASVLVLRSRAGGGTVRQGLNTRTVVVAALLLIVLGSGAWVARPFILKSPVRAGADVIAVLPFQASGPAVELLGEGLVDLLTTNLDEVGAIRTVHPRTTLHQYRQHALDGSIDLDGALRVGRAVGAGSVLLGSVVAVAGEVRITAELHATDGGRVMARAQKSGSGDNVLGLVDELSIELMRDIWRSREPLPRLRVSAITTPSVAAIRAYLRGEQHYRRLQWDSAAVAFSEAVQHDSTFALAHFRLGETYGWRESLGSEIALRHSSAAARFADRLPVRERALVIAHQLHEQGSVAAIDSFRSYVDRYPDDVAGWYMLADARFHASSVTGSGLDELLEGFERAHEMDPTYAQPYAHMLEIALMLDDSARFDRYLAAFDRHVAGQSEVFHVVRDVRWLPRAEALAAAERAAQGDGAQRGAVLNRIGMAASLRAAGDTPDAAFMLEVIEILGRHLPAETALRTLTSQSAAMLAATGRMREADRRLEPLRAVNVDHSLGTALHYIALGVAPPDLFRPERQLLRDAQPRRSVAYWRSLAALGSNDVDEAARHLDSARRDTTTGREITAELLRGVEGMIAVERGDTIRGMRLMREALTQHGYSPQRASQAGMIRLHYALLQAQRPDTRAEGIRRLQQFRLAEFGTLPVVLIPLAEAHAAEGRTDVAAELYQQFIHLFQDADPELQPRREYARLALQRLGPVDRAN